MRHFLLIIKNCQSINRSSSNDCEFLESPNSKNQNSKCDIFFQIFRYSQSATDFGSNKLARPPAAFHSSLRSRTCLRGLEWPQRLASKSLKLALRWFETTCEFQHSSYETAALHRWHSKGHTRFFLAFYIIKILKRKLNFHPRYTWFHAPCIEVAETDVGPPAVEMSSWSV